MSDKAYVLVHGQVNNFDRYFGEYIPGVFPLLQKHGGTVLVGTPEPDEAEGTLSGNWHVIIEFPSMEAAKAWYNDPEYKPFLDMRVNELIDGGTLTFLPGFVPPG